RAVVARLCVRRCWMRARSTRGGDPAEGAGGAGRVPAQEPGAHLLLRLTERGQRRRSGGAIPRGGIPERQGAEGWGRGLAAGGVSHRRLSPRFTPPGRA